MKHCTIGVLLAVMAMMLCSCSNTFTIKGRIKGLGDQMLHVAYATPQGVKDAMVPAQADRFEFKAKLESDDWTLVYIYDMQSQPIAHFAVEQGSKVQVRGDLSQRHNLEVKGPDVDEQWYKFMAQHSADYDNPNHDNLDRAIEKYVADNPDDLVSTLLVLCDYSRLNNEARMKQLLSKLTEKPEGLMASYDALQQHVAKPKTAIASLLLYESAGDYAAFSPTTASASLLYFWTGTPSASAEMSQVKQLGQSSGNRLLIADVFIDPDTMSWRGILKSSGTQWKHYWAPAGPLDRQLQGLDLRSTPCYVVTDSAGKIVYNGAEMSQAQAAVSRLLR